MVVYLIGAGPGDADLITLTAVKALNKADVVLYDYLANEEILAHAPETAEKIYVGKKAGEHYKTQDQIVLQFKDRNPNGSMEAITSVCDESGLVCAMMPHPERACEEILGSTDGLNFFKGFI